MNPDLLVGLDFRGGDGGPAANVINRRSWTGFRPLRRGLPALLGAMILSQVLPSTAPAAVKTGVTVLVHGFVSNNEVASVTPYEYWGGRNGRNLTELLERFGSGLVWEYNPATGNYLNVTHSTDDNGQFRIPRGNWGPAFAGQQILLFDWTAGSDEGESGQAEAAADALFASLMKFQVDGEPIISTSPYAALRPLHFIGHSRGTVVVSETVQRLGRFNIRVNYVTYLDIHDFGQPPILKDESFHDPAVQVWENADYVDAVYQQNPASMCTVNPAGRPLRLPAALERDVTTLTALPYAELCALHQRPHAWVKEYYWATVNTSGPNIDRPQIWFEDDNGVGSVRGFGFDRWLRRGGFEQGPDASLARVRCVVDSDAVPYVWSPPDENNSTDRNDVPPILFNGDFELPDLDRGIGELTPANSMAGWRYFGGGGSALVESKLLEPNNYFLELRDTWLVARHNRFFLPPEARELLFALAVDHVPSLGTHQLEVRIGPDVVRRFSIDTETDGFEVRRVEEHQLTGLGRVNTLTFELLTAPGPVRTAEIRLDNINFVTAPTGWIHSLYRLDATNWRLLWRSWPDATFRLDSSSNFITWPTIRSSSGAGNAGSFTILDTGQPHLYFRGWVDPAR